MSKILVLLKLTHRRIDKHFLHIYVLVSVNCYYLVSVSEKIFVGPHGVPDPPSLAQMTFTQYTSLSELKFDSVAPPGGQI